LDDETGGAMSHTPCSISECDKPATGEPVLVDFASQYGPSGTMLTRYFPLCDQHQAEAAQKTIDLSKLGTGT
jgi:hypothetical protein